MTQLLDDLLVIGFLEAGVGELNPILLYLPGFCRDLVSEMQLGASSQHTIALISNEGCEQVYLDEKVRRQLVTNLVSNALQDSPIGGKVDFK